MYELFCRLQTQWRIGMGGAVGFDYCAIYPLLDRAAESPEHWDELLSDLQVMEIAAIPEINKT